jgi:hypothetical protein
MRVISALGVVAAAALVAMACGGPAAKAPVVGGGQIGGNPGGGQDAGAAQDAGAGPDAGPGQDAGPGPDAGVAPDAGTSPDAGTDGGISIIVPNSAGWAFYQQADGLTSSEVMGASADEGGNIWVAGGTAGVFVLRNGATTFQQFTLADGLHPYGYMPDGSPADTNPYLEAISISGGPAGTAFVGYMGKPVPKGVVDCEGNWDGPNPDPAIYKSGDADKLTLTGSDINVVHYDIFSGPNVIRPEPRGREKLCNVVRIAYQHGTNYVWFGANHGFAKGLANFAGSPTCDGQYACAGVWEHVHPAINAYSSDDPTNFTEVFLTGDYYGIDFDPLTKDPWFGGSDRTTRFRFFTSGEDYFVAGDKTQLSQYAANRMDIWPDQVTEPAVPRPSQRVDDAVSGIAAMPDGSAWIGSFAHGLRHIDADGKLLEDATSRLLFVNLGAVARDPSDDSVWVGYRWQGGLSRLMPDGSIRHYDANSLGNALANSPVRDIQFDTSATPRRVIVSFEIGAVGVYSGQ